MKFKISLLLIFFLSVHSGFSDDNKPDDFEFVNPNTWGYKLAALLPSNVYDSIEDKLMDFPPTYYELEHVPENETRISFLNSSSSGASWYTRKLIFDKEIQGYEFLIYNYGGGSQTARILFDEDRDRMELYLKGGGIWGETEWIYFSELVFPLYDYVP